MPWCEQCSRFFNPNTVPASGECPGCGRVLDRPAALSGHARASEERVKVPWHFWLLLGALVAYLGWRLVQGIDALIGWLL